MEVYRNKFRFAKIICYANAYKGKKRKSGDDTHNHLIIEEETTSIPRKGWAEMIKRVYEIDSL